MELFAVSITDTELPPRFATRSREPSTVSASPFGLAGTVIVALVAPVVAFSTDTVLAE